MRTIQRQRGAATLIVALVLLAVITLVVLFTAQTSIVEQRISGNEARARQAFEAAEAGVQQAIAYLNANPAIVTASNTCVGENDVLPGTAGNTVTLSPTYNASGASAFPNGTTYTAQLFWPVCVAGHPTDQIPDTFLVSSTGYSDDKSAQKTIRELIGAVPNMPNMPRQPLISKGYVALGGNLTVQNNSNNMSIWSGGDLQWNDPAAETRTSVEGATNVIDSTMNNLGPDIVKQDSTLSNATNTEFFQNYFGDGATADTVRSESQLVMSGSSLDTSALASADGKMVFIDGNTSLNGETIGSGSAPVVLVVNGDLTIRGNTVINGVVYVTGHADVSGNGTINGSLIVQGNVDFGSGSFMINYRPYSNNPGSGFNGRIVGIAGSWRDF